MIVKRKMTPAQIEQLNARQRPSQDDINQAANDLFVYLLNKIENMEARDETLLPVQPDRAS